MKGYEGFFGFHEPPFSLAPNTRFLFESASYREALSQVGYALERREPLVVVTGDIGTGKTLLCRTVLERLERRTFLSVVNDPMLGGDDLLKQMLQDFGVISKDRTKLAPASRHDLTHALQEFLLSLAPLDAHAVLIVDEAHHMQPDALEQIRLVSNVHDERGTMLQIILVGQTDLEALLARPELRQLRQRVSRRVQLGALTPAEVDEYIAHRLAVARRRPTRSQMPGAVELQRAIVDWETPAPGVVFIPEAIAAVSALSAGVPRIVNLLCDRALEAAFARQARTIDAPLVHEAARALDVQTAASVTPAAAPLPVSPTEPEEAPVLFGGAAPEPPSSAPVRRLVAAAAVVAVVIGLWFAGRALSGRRAAESDAAPSTTSVTSPTVPAAPDVAPAAPPPAASSPAPAAETAPPAVAEPAPPRPSTGGRFEVVIGSFRTESRSSSVAEAVKAAGEPVRQRVAGGWQQVLAGPYPSRADAEAAQQRLDRAGFGGTQIVPSAR